MNRNTYIKIISQNISIMREVNPYILRMHVQADDLKKYYGLQFVTSSLQKKAEAEELKEKLDQDSTRVPAEESSSETAADTEHKCSVDPSVAYEIAASAASYVRSRDKDGVDVENSCRNGDQQQQREEGESSPRSYKSEVAVSLTASTMTVMVAAGEKEKQETAKDLRSPHSAPCEWFVCDDTSTYTRCFVIQVTSCPLTSTRI